MSWRSDVVIRAGNLLPEFVARSLRPHRATTNALRQLVNRFTSADPTPVVIRSGHAKDMTIVVLPKVEKFYWAGTHETSVQAAIASRLRDGSTFWDVGAHAGFFSLMAGRLVGSKGQVHAFEPVPENRERLVRSILLSRLNNVTIHSCALSDRAGQIVLYDAGLSVMWTSIEGASRQASIRVEANTLDSVAETVRPPDLIKIDVEGGELAVLRGAPRLLAKRRPTMVIEFLLEERRREAQLVLKGYLFRRLDDKNWLVEPAS
jgi:FkbM family methyltransferase